MKSFSAVLTAFILTFFTSLNAVHAEGNISLPEDIQAHLSTDAAIELEVLYSHQTPYVRAQIEEKIRDHLEKSPMPKSKYQYDAEILTPVYEYISEVNRSSSRHSEEIVDMISVLFDICQIIPQMINYDMADRFEYVIGLLNETKQAAIIEAVKGLIKKYRVDPEKNSVRNESELSHSLPNRIIQFRDEVIKLLKYEGPGIEKRCDGKVCKTLVQSMKAELDAIENRIWPTNNKTHFQEISIPLPQMSVKAGEEEPVQFQFNPAVETSGAVARNGNYFLEVSVKYPNRPEAREFFNYIGPKFSKKEMTIAFFGNIHTGRVFRGLQSSRVLAIRHSDGFEFYKNFILRFAPVDSGPAFDSFKDLVEVKWIDSGERTKDGRPLLLLPDEEAKKLDWYLAPGTKDAPNIFKPIDRDDAADLFNFIKEYPLQALTIKDLNLRECESLLADASAK